jgi:methyl-accepting chemotaxis protein
VDIVENIVQSVSEYVKSKELRIIFDTNIEEKIIACDPIKIERIMMNLISNAIKFSNPNDGIYVNVVDSGDVVKISVKDTGIGIEKKHLDLIFQRFYQADKSLSRNSEGTGIGLSLLKSIVELHGGNISVESEVGKGSIFTVELPARTIENAEAAENTNYLFNKIEMLNIEFSDIYSRD